jgi:FlaA1/EpsC-like NDP-sugar epimerase
MQLNRDYSRRANLLTDTWIILQTLCPYRLGVLVCYGSLLAVSYWLACGLASNFAPPQLSTIEFGQELGLVLALQLVCLTWRNQCNGLLSYFSFPELKQLGASLIGAASGLMLWSFASGGGPALNIILIDALVAFCVMSGFRTLLRRWRERQAGEEQEDVRPTRVGIIGAGSTGAQLALELTEMPECLLDGWQEKLDEVVIAMPEANRDRVREIENLLSKTRLKFYSVSCLAGFPDRRQAA